MCKLNPPPPRIHPDTIQPSDKFKFNFDWDAAEDTSKDLNPLYNNTHGESMRGGDWT